MVTETAHTGSGGKEFQNSELMPCLIFRCLSWAESCSNFR